MYVVIKATFLTINTLISRRSPSGNLGKLHIMFSQNHQYRVCTYPAAQHNQTFESVPLPLSSPLHYARTSNTPLKEPRITETNVTRVRADMESHFCFNPGQPHHLISMYKRTSEYKRASKYKWHERLKYVICHPRKVTWQLSCRD